MIAIALQTLDKSPIHGQRFACELSENVGWFIYCGELSEAVFFYKPMHAHHLSNYLPLVEKYLA